MSNKSINIEHDEKNLIYNRVNRPGNNPNYPLFQSYSKNNYRKQNVDAIVSNDFTNLNSTLYIANSPNAIISDISIKLFNQSNVGIYVENSPGIILENINIEGSSQSDRPFEGIHLQNSNNSLLKNITISNFYSQYDGSSNQFIFSSGIHVTESSNVTVINNHINNLKASGLIGILSTKSEYISINNNIIENLQSLRNLEHEEVAGVYLYNSESILVSRNTVRFIFSQSNDYSSIAWGITFFNSGLINIKENNITSVQANSIYPVSTGIDFFFGENINVEANQIHNITTRSFLSVDSYSTGIYYALSEYVTLSNNILSTINSLGRASYGFFVDFSNYSIIKQNSISEIETFSTERDTSIGIALRKSPFSKIINNNIFDLQTVLQLPDFRPGYHQSSNIGISLDRSNNILLENNKLSQFVSESNLGFPSDNIGIIISYSNDIRILNNEIDDLNVRRTENGVVNGISSWRSENSTIINNQITNLRAHLTSYGINILYVDEFYIYDNHINQISAFNSIFGVAITSSNQGKIRNNSFLNLRGALHIIFIENFDSQKIYFESNSLNNNEEIRATAISIDNSDIMYISYNNMSVFDNWLKRSNSSTNIYCLENSINGELHQSICDDPPFEVKTWMVSNTIVVIILLILLIPKKLKI